MKKYIKPLQEKTMSDRYGNAYGTCAPNNFELMHKLNEVIGYLNSMIGAGIFPLPDDYEEEQ